MLPFIALQGASSETVCANVVLRLRQQLTFEREAFEGTLIVDNASDVPIEDFSVTLNFHDRKGDVVAFATPEDVANFETLESNQEDYLFFARLQDGSWNPSENGTIPSKEKKEVVYLFIPTSGAAGESVAGEIYSIGATITYRLRGELRTVDVLPDFIQVKPMPSLLLQYFLPGDMMANESAPFALRIVNQSPYAKAPKVKVESQQPEIIENQQGLLIDFSILGCKVNGASVQPTLLANFGDIGPGVSGMAWWSLVSTLPGRFTEVRGQVTHALELGGSLTSLVKADTPMVRKLLGTVIVDLPGRDGIMDFLATDTFSTTVSSAKIYESDTDSLGEPVTFISEGDARVQVKNTNGELRLAVNDLAATLFYVRIPTPVAGMRAVRAQRSDGKLLPNVNAWISAVYRASEPPAYYLNIFDTNKKLGDEYVLAFFETELSNSAPEISFEPNKTKFSASVGTLFSLQVKGIDPEGDAVALSSDTLPAGAVFKDNGNGQGLLSWHIGSSQDGVYSMRFRATDGQLQSARSVELTVLKPAASLSLSDWQKHYWADLSDMSIIGPKADADRDGLPNLLEYVLDLDPTAGDLTEQPRPEIIERDGQRYFSLCYRQRTDLSGFRVKIQTTADLFVWRDLDVIVELVESAQESRTGMVELWRAIDPVPLTTPNEARFMRLVVEETAN